MAVRDQVLTFLVGDYGLLILILPGEIFPVRHETHDAGILIVSFRLMRGDVARRLLRSELAFLEAQFRRRR